MSRRGRRPRAGTFGDVGPAWLGVHPGPDGPYTTRGIDDALENALGGEATLVVVAGEPLAGTTASVARAARRMLGGQAVVAPGAALDADLSNLVEVAARHRAVVWLDGAPLAVLDRLTPPVLAAARSAGVRLVVTAHRALLDADHSDTGTTAVLRDATVATVGPLTDREAGTGPHPAGGFVGSEVLGGGQAGAGPFLDLVGDGALPRSIAQVAAAWDALAVPVALTPDRLASLVPAALQELGAATAPESTIRAEIRRGTRRAIGGLRVLTRGRRRGEVHLAPHPLLRTAPLATSGLAALLVDLLTPEERRRVARTALAVGEDATASALLLSLEVGGLGPADAVRVARAAGRTAAAAPWFRSALERCDDDALRVEAQVGLADVLSHTGTARPDASTRRAEARRLMEAAVPDQRALLWLADDADHADHADHADDTDGTDGTDGGAHAAARPWWVRAAAGPNPVLAAEAAWRVAELELADGRVDAAVPLLEQARTRPGWWTGRATLALGRAHRLRGDLDEAESMLRSRLERWGSDANEARVELARLAEERGDPDQARAWYREAPFSDEAVLRLTELDLAAGEYDEVLRRMEGAREGIDWWDDAAIWAWRDLRFRDRQDRARGCWLAGEAAYRLELLGTDTERFGLLRKATEWFEHATGTPEHRSGLRDLRLAQIAIARDDVLDGYRRLVPLMEGTGPVAEEARAAAAPIAAEAGRRAAALRNQPARVVVLRNGETRVVYGP